MPKESNYGSVQTPDNELDISSHSPTLKRFTDTLQKLQSVSEDRYFLLGAIDLIICLEEAVGIMPTKFSEKHTVEISGNLTMRLKRILYAADGKSGLESAILLSLGGFLHDLQRTDDEKRTQYEIKSPEDLKRRLNAIAGTFKENPNKYSSSRQLFSVVLNNIEITLEIPRNPKGLFDRLACVLAALLSAPINAQKSVLEKHSEEVNLVEETILRESQKFRELELRRFGQITSSISCPNELAHAEGWVLNQEHSLGIIDNDEFNETLAMRLNNVLNQIETLTEDSIQQGITNLLGVWLVEAENFVRRQQQQPVLTAEQPQKQQVQETRGNFRQRLLLTLEQLFRRIFPQAPL